MRWGLTLWIFLWCLAGFASSTKSSDAHPESLILAIGERRSLPAQGDLIMGADKVLKAVDHGATFEIEALKAGHSELRTGKKTYQVSVLRQAQMRTWNLLKARTPYTLGLHVDVQQGQVVLVGKILSLEEWKQIAQACLVETCDYQSRFQVPERLRKKIQDHFSSLFQSLGYGVFRLRWEPEIQLLIPPAQKIAPALERITSGYGLEIVPDANALELAPSIRAQILIMEVKRSQGKQYGLSWPTSYQAKLVPTGPESTDLSVTANFLESHGVGRTLASPTLLCRSGKEAEFLAGGELPIKIMNYTVQDVIWKKYGILLRIKPQADFAGRMSIEIETEVSSIDESHNVDGVPGFFTNRVQTHFDLTGPRTIALSGLISHTQSESAAGLLGLTNLPILGPLFSSRNFQDDQSELVILVRPEIVNAHEEE
jgi:pilus assembly protein CpaC